MLDVIYVSSQSTHDELITRGIDPARIKLYPGGIDVDLFNPKNRNGIFSTSYLLPGGLKLLYVGHVSKEKNLNLLVQAFKRLIAVGQKVQLVVVGRWALFRRNEGGVERFAPLFHRISQG